MHIMKDHEEEHAGANLYKPTICDRLLIEDENQFSCPECNKKFTLLDTTDMNKVKCQSCNMQCENKKKF